MLSPREATSTPVYVATPWRVPFTGSLLRLYTTPASAPTLIGRLAESRLSGHGTNGYFEIETGAGIRPMFLEADLGNQAMRVWEQKTRSYLQFAISGGFTRLFRQQQFRVLVITTSQRRLAKIRSVIARQTDKLFWLSDFQSINRASFWSSVWLRPKGDQRLTLI
jgi:hypothetical protein